MSGAVVLVTALILGGCALALRSLFGARGDLDQEAERVFAGLDKLHADRWRRYRDQTFVVNGVGLVVATAAALALAWWAGADLVIWFVAVSFGMPVTAWVRIGIVRQNMYDRNTKLRRLEAS